MIRNVVRDSIIYTLSTLFSRGIQFILLPIYTRFLNPIEYGSNDILTIFSIFVNLLLTLEILQAVARLYPETADVVSKRRISSTGLFFIFSTYALFLITTLILSRKISVLLFGDVKFTNLVMAASIALVLNGLFVYMQSQLRWDLKSLDYSIASAVSAFFSAIGTLYCIGILKTGGIGIFIGQSFGSILGISVSYIRNRNAYGFKFSFSQLRELLAFSYPFVFSSALLLLSTYADRFFINQYYSLNEVGIYGIAARFSGIVSLLLVGFNMSLTPLIYANVHSDQLPREIEALFEVYVMLASLVVSIFFLFSDEIIQVFTGPEYHAAKSIMPILVLSTIISNMYIFTPGLTIARKTKPIILISAIATSTNTLCNLILLPILSLIGSALASLITSIVVFLSYYFISRRYFSIQIVFKQYIPMILAVSISWGAMYLFLYASNLSFQIKFTIKILMLLIYIYVLLRTSPRARTVMHSILKKL